MILSNMKQRNQSSKIILTLAGLFLLFSCSHQRSENDDSATIQKENKAPNIILLIGDGMGLSQLSAIYYFGEKEEPSFERFTHIGLINTSSSSHKITDSGAGATAFSTGKRTFNGAIGVGPDSVPLANIPELLFAKGYLSGLIATCQITHATPAAFFAHYPDRNNELILASQLHRSPIHFIAAAGYGYFIQETANYLDSLRDKGFIVDTSQIKVPDDIRPTDRLIFLTEKNTVPKVSEGRGDFSTSAFEAAISYFQKAERSFFLMIEGSQIDWGGHDNDADYLISEMLDFEKVVEAALDFAEKDGNTVVVVTSDHEAGGFTLGANEKDTSYSSHDNIVATFSTTGHSASLVPVMAFGPGAERFAGIYNNTDIFEKILGLVK